MRLSMNVEQFSTPKKGQYEPESPPALPSCLKSNEKSPYSHKQSPSQVRFSLPSKDESTSSVEAEYSPTKSSSAKIVFPASCDDSMTHFMDIQNKVMIDVPEDIWKFHHKNSNKTRLSVPSLDFSTSGKQNAQSSHRRTQSLQSVIAETIQSYHKSPRKLNFTSADMSPVRLAPNENSELYLRSDSPLNKFKVPVPLEISLPPYLSPENKSKRRNSIVYDGEGYSNFLGDDSSSDTSEGQLGEDSMEKSDVNISDLSIPSASHDFSFEADEDIDKVLGIDRDANVSLKSQARNLLKKPSSTGDNLEKQPPVSSPIKRSSISLENTPLPIKSNEQSNSLKILMTPSKTIHIPDFTQEPTPIKPNALSGFFAISEGESDRNEIGNITPTKARDELDQNYRFPSFAPLSNKTTSQQLDFLKVADSPNNSAFEDRRRMLQSQSRSPAKPNGHMHRRSRSIHNTGELFMNSMKPLPHPGTPERVPERSPLRPSTTPTKINEQSESTSPLANKPFENVSSTNTEPMMGNSNDIYEPSRHSKVSSASQTNKQSSHNHILMEKINSRPWDDTGVIGVAPQLKVTPAVSSPEASSSQSSQTSLARKFFEDDYCSSNGSASSPGSNIVSSHSTDEDICISQDSIEIIGENKSSDILPLSTYHSFRTPLEVPSEIEPNVKIKFTPTNANMLSPSRQLSNGYSHSSYESDFSARSHQTSVTSYSGQGPITTEAAKARKSDHYLNDKPFNPSNKRYSVDNSQATKSQYISSKRSSAIQSYSNDDKTIKENINGKLVDVIILDDDSDDDGKSTRKNDVGEKGRTRGRPNSFHEEALENYQEILDLCDTTAERARNIIIELVKTKGQARPKMNQYQHGVPPLPTFRDFNLSNGRSQTTLSTGIDIGEQHSGKSSPKPYVSKISRLMKTRNSADFL